VVDPREVYHSLNPLAALSPVPKPGDPESAALQRENEALYRQLLVNGLLAVLLPTEDLENDCLTSLVGQILSEMIIGNVVVGKISQPWMILECLIILARVLGRKDTTKETLGEGVVEAIAQEASGDPAPVPARQAWSFSSLFWLIVHWVFLIFAAGRILVLTVMSSSSLPSRLSLVDDGKRGFAPGVSATTKTALGIPTKAPSKAPLLTFKLWTCISTLIEVDTRMPWLSGFLSMLQLGIVRTPGRLAGLDGPLDR
jgi:PXA domain-containing protein